MKTVQRATSFLLVCLLTLSFLPAALADANDALIAQARQSILNRCQDQNVDVRMDQKISAENGIDYTITDLSFHSEDGNGTMRVEVYLDISQGASSDLRLGLMDFGFMLLVLPPNAASLSDMQAYLPNHVIDMTNGRYQELNWPVMLDKDLVLSVCLTYVVPKTMQNFGFAQTNLFGSGAGDLTEKGPIYTYSFTRCANDFDLINNSTKVITELYAVPSDAATSGDNWIALSGYTQLDIGKWMPIIFDHSDDADTVSNDWLLTFVFADGSTTSFSGLDLHNIIDLYLEEDDDQLRLYAQY